MLKLKYNNGDVEVDWTDHNSSHWWRGGFVIQEINFLHMTCHSLRYVYKLMDISFSGGLSVHHSPGLAAQPATTDTLGKLEPRNYSIRCAEPLSHRFGSTAHLGLGIKLDHHSVGPQINLTGPSTGWIEILFTHSPGRASGTNDLVEVKETRTLCVININ